MAYFSYMGQKEMSDASQDASLIQMQQYKMALELDKQRYAAGQQRMDPYQQYGLIGMERMLGTTPMQNTMGGDAQQLTRSQQPTLEERTETLFGEGFNEQMLGNMLGTAPTSLGGLLTGQEGPNSPEEGAKRDQYKAEQFLLNKAHNLLVGGPRAQTGNYLGKVDTLKDKKITAAQKSPGNRLKIAAAMRAKAQGRAYGGPVSAGQPYMVGEQGPEMIVPQQAGQVIPNMQGNMNMLGMGMNPGTQPRQRGGPRGQAFAQWAQQAHAAALAAGRGGPRSRGQMQPGQMGIGMPGQQPGQQGQPMQPQMAPGGPPSIVGPGGTNPALQQGQYMQPGMPQMQGQNLLASMQDRALASGRGGARGRSAAFAAQGARGGPMRGVQGRAWGGPVQANNPYMVGETGPEVVVPGGGGQKSLQQIQQAMKRKALGLPPQGQKQAAQPAPEQGQYGMGMLPGAAPDQTWHPPGYEEQPQWPDQMGYDTPNWGRNPEYRDALGQNPIGEGMGAYLTNLQGQADQFGNLLGPGPGGGDPRDSSDYMLSDAGQSFMDWQANAEAKPTTPQPGILEQGPPQRPEFDFSAYQESPWYQQGLDQGINAIERSAVGQGGLYSGATGQALNQFGQDYAMSKYMPARQMAGAESQDDFQRWLHGTLYPSQEMIRIGQNTAVGQANLGQQNSQYQGNILSQMGNSQAGNILGQGQANANMYGNLGDQAGMGAGMGLAALLALL